MAAVEGGIWLRGVILIIIIFWHQAAWRECNATAELGDGDDGEGDDVVDERWRGNTGRWN